MSRGVAERTVGVKGENAVGGPGVQNGSEGVAFDVGVIDQEPRAGGDDEGRILGRAVAVGGSDRRVIETPSTGYFACGRTTKSTIEKFDETSKNFLEEELETSPYTHCVFNAQIGILGIARKTNLAPTVKGIAARIQQLLSQTKVVASSYTSVEIAPIPDPEDFLRALDSAYLVSRFAATFHGPNPFDADEAFQKPLSVYLRSANGKSGRAQIQGDDLNREVLKAVTRSTAATGNEATARLRKKKSGKATTMHLRGDPVKGQYEEDDKPEDVLADLEKIYERVREK